MISAIFMLYFEIHIGNTFKKSAQISTYGKNRADLSYSNLAKLRSKRVSLTNCADINIVLLKNSITFNFAKVCIALCLSDRISVRNAITEA